FTSTSGGSSASGIASSGAVVQEATRQAARKTTEWARIACLAMWLVGPQPRQGLSHDASTLTSLMRPDAPDLMDTAALRHCTRSATKAMSSSLALPSTGGDFSFASQVPSAACAREEVRALGFTLICMNTVAISACRLTFTVRGARRSCARPFWIEGLEGFTFTSDGRVVSHQQSRDDARPSHKENRDRRFDHQDCKIQLLIDV